MNAKQIKLHNQADEAWDQAWDQARDSDAKAGRRYDRFSYAEAAHLAKAKVLKACGCSHCLSVKKRAAELLQEVR